MEGKVPAIRTRYVVKCPAYAAKGAGGGRLNVRIDRRIRLNNTRQLNTAK